VLFVILRRNLPASCRMPDDTSQQYDGLHIRPVSMSMCQGEADMQNRSAEMNRTIRFVNVIRLPEKSSCDTERLFLNELESCAKCNRPCLVIDCSIAIKMDNSVIYLLLLCLEQAMKRNGDARLAGVSAEGRAILKSLGIDRLFELFDSNDAAVNSFQPVRTHAISSNGGSRTFSGCRTAASGI
jgi:anti-anti-sigma regulatory factor